MIPPGSVLARARTSVSSAVRLTTRDAAPFVMVALVGVGSVLLPPYEHRPVSIILMLIALGLTAMIHQVSICEDRYAWMGSLPTFMSFLIIALARDASGAGNSGLAPLVALPIFWIALTGTRRQLHVAAVLTAGVFLVPLALIGPPSYPTGDWRRALLWTALAVFVAPVVQRVVRQLAEEKQRAEDAGAELEAIVQSARLTSIITTDSAGVIQTFSIGAEELLGYPAEDLIGKAELTLFHDPDEVSTVANELRVTANFEVFATLGRTRAPSRIWTYVHQDGHRLYVRLAVTELQDHVTGALVGYLGVAIDATTAVLSERALTASEARWRVLMDNLPGTTVLTVDEDYVVRVVTGTGAMRQGFQGKEGTPLGEVSNPANYAKLVELIDEAMAGRSATGEIAASATGDPHEVVVRALPAEGGEGRRAMILARNIARDRERERATMSAKVRAERLFTDAPHGVAILTPSGQVLEVNRALQSLLQMSPEQLAGRPLDELSIPEDPSLAEHLAQTVAARGTTVDGEWTIATPEPRIVHATVSSRLLPADDHGDELVMVNVVDVSDRYRYERELAHLADHDALTGLTNRRRFDEELSDHMHLCARSGPRGALLLLDLDHFKEVNDTLGHGAGDELIRVMASVLRRHRRRSDIVARLGGDEFAVLLPDADRAAAEIVAVSVIDDLRSQAASMSGVRRRVTASIGVVTVQAAMNRGEDILALADMTMYDAKESGRNRFVVLDEETSHRPGLESRLRWKARIEDALDHDQFVLLLQPILDLHTREVRSAEALIRLREGDRLVPPIEFLPVAERSGQMPAVDGWVVEHSVEILSRLRETDPAFQLEVNLSGLSIGEPGLEQTIVDSLAAHGVEPSALIMEITETAAVGDIEVARQFAERLTALGCQFALDDFGAGFGSFYYLKHLLFDYVKIDGEFVANCRRSSVDRSILRSIAGIARDLGKQTIAEFVTDHATLEIVAAEGVDLAQGYLIGGPVTPEEFVATYLRSSASAH